MSRLVLFIGTDARLLDQNIERCVEKVLSRDLRQWNYEVINGDEMTLEDVLLRADSQPFASSCRVTLWRQPPLMLEKRKGGALSEAQQLFLDYLAQADERNLLLCRLETDKTAGTFLKKCFPLAEVHRCDPLTGHEWRAWAETFAAQYKKSLTRDALGHLEMLSSQWSSTQLELEMEKAFLYWQNEPLLNRSHLLKVLTPTTQESIFHLLDAIIAGKADKALSIWHDLRTLGETPAGVRYRLMDQVKTLLAVQAYVESGLSQQEMTKALGKHPYVIKKSLTQCRRLSQHTLVGALRVLVDGALRRRQTTELSEDEALTEMILSLCARFQHALPNH